jgi:hypothetical protein
MADRIDFKSLDESLRDGDFVRVAEFMDREGINLDNPGKAIEDYLEIIRADRAYSERKSTNLGKTIYQVTEKDKYQVVSELVIDIMNSGEVMRNPENSYVQDLVFEYIYSLPDDNILGMYKGISLVPIVSLDKMGAPIISYPSQNQEK